MSQKYFISIIWGYSRSMYSFSPEENYHLQTLKVAKSMGFVPLALIRQSPGDMEGDPNFDRDIKVIDYKNFFNFLGVLLKYRNAVFYVNSYEWQSFLVPFICPKSIFMGHTHVVRQTKIKQIIQDLVFKAFARVRLNNEEEKQFLIARGTAEKKLFVLPLAVSSKYFYFIENPNRKDILYFGNVTEKKNLPTILRALSLVRKQKPNVKLHLVGKILDSSFWPTVNELGLKEAVVSYGFLPLADLARTLNSFLIYANSSFDEGQCVAVYNAALCGAALCLPGIMSFSGVFKNMALFHRPKDYHALAQNMLSYLDNAKLAEELNQKCRQYILKCYNTQVVEAGLKQLFNL